MHVDLTLFRALFTEKGSTYTHILDARDLEVKHRVKEAKQKAGATRKPPRKLFGESLESASDEVLVQMPKQASFNKRVHAERKGDHPKPPSNLEDIKLQNITNSMNENFLMWDSWGPSNLLIMFATVKTL